jgi:hypothetical protein
MHDRTAIDRMAAAVPDAKLIATLRNPVDRAWSHYLMRRSLGYEPLSLGEVLEGARSGAPGAATEFDTLVRRGEYVDQLEHVTSHYPREQLLVHLFDDLARDAASVYDTTCAFLGISTGFRPPYLQTAVNAHAQYRSITVRRLLKRRGPSWFRKGIGRLNVTHPPPEPLDPSWRAELVDHFHPYNRRLETWLGRDLSHWDC